MLTSRCTPTRSEATNTPFKVTKRKGMASKGEKKGKMIKKQSGSDDDENEPQHGYVVTKYCLLHTTTLSVCKGIGF